jgi:hypothetical protein
MTNEIKKSIKQCDICGTKADSYVDGKTIYGPWANMCLSCFETKGTGLGTGKGQLYMNNENGQFVKLAG